MKRIDIGRLHVIFHLPGWRKDAHAANPENYPLFWRRPVDRPNLSYDWEMNIPFIELRWQSAHQWNRRHARG